MGTNSVGGAIVCEMSTTGISSGGSQGVRSGLPKATITSTGQKHFFHLFLALKALSMNQLQARKENIQVRPHCP